MASPSGTQDMQSMHWFTPSSVEGVIWKQERRRKANLFRAAVATAERRRNNVTNVQNVLIIAWSTTTSWLDCEIANLQQKHNNKKCHECENLNGYSYNSHLDSRKTTVVLKLSYAYWYSLQLPIEGQQDPRSLFIHTMDKANSVIVYTTEKREKLQPRFELMTSK